MRSTLSRSSLRRSGGTLTNAVSALTLASFAASWPLTTTRYYAVDYVSGNDANVGFSDVSMAFSSAGSVALKTLTAFLAILPRNGAGRSFVLGIKGPSTNTSSTITYFKPDGVTVDDLDFRGFSGYRYSLERSTQDFSNTANDKSICAPVLGQIGPNGDGSFTVGSSPAPTVNTFTIASGTLTAKPGLYAFRVRFTGNITAALANKCFNVWKNNASELILGFNAAAIPASGDTFFIERPGVIINHFFSMSESAGGNGTIGFSTSFAHNIVGVRCAQSNAVANFINGAALTQTISFCEFDNRLSVGVIASLSIRETYVDELLASITTGVGLRWTQNGSSLLTGSSNAQVQLFCSAIIGGSVPANFMNRPQAAGTLFIASYTCRDFVLQGGKPTGGHGVAIGNLASTFYRRAYFDNASILPGQSTGIEIRGLDINNCVGKACIRFQSVVHGTLQFWDDIVSTDGGNTDVLISVGGYQFNTLMLGARNEPITAVAALGDIRTHDATIISLATINADTYIDTGSNVYVGATSARRITRRTPGIIGNVPVLTADPTTPLNGDYWITDIVGVRSLCARIGGATFRTVLA